MKKRLLVLTDALPPAFAPRMAFLLDALSQKGYEITAFSIQQAGCCNLSTGHATIQLFDYNLSHPILKTIKFVSEAFFGYKDSWFYKQIKPHIQGKHFDAVLCSTYETFPLPTALQIAQEQNIPFIADLRDITEQFGAHYFKNRHPKAPWLGKWFSDIKIKARNKVLKQAQAITSVSPWHVQFLREQVLGMVSGTLIFLAAPRYSSSKLDSTLGLHKNSTGSVTDTKPHIHLIYNGYDATKFYFKPISSEKFTIVYTGRLIDFTTRNPFLLFDAIQELIAEGRMDKQQCQLQWYMDNESRALLRQALTRYPVIQPLCQLEQLVSATKIPALLQSASVALLLSNKQTPQGPKGIMTTKFFEALGTEKPVLCVTSDEACLASAIQQTNAGVAATHVEQVKTFILEKYTEWQQNGYTHQNVVIAQKEKFSRQSMAKQFENVILSVL